MTAYGKKAGRLSAIASCAVSLIVFAVLMFPLYWMAVTSLKKEIEIFRVPPTLLPQVLNTDSYFAQLKQGDFNMFRSFKNSFVISSCAMLISTRARHTGFLRDSPIPL